MSATMTPATTSARIPAYRWSRRPTARTPTLRPVPTFPVGGTVTWTYMVTNTGNVHLTNVTGNRRPTRGYRHHTSALARPEPDPAPTGTAVSRPVLEHGHCHRQTSGRTNVSDDDPSHYFGQNPEHIDGQEDQRPGRQQSAPDPTFPVGGTVTWTYIVTNTGNVDLTNVTVSDDNVGA